MSEQKEKKTKLGYYQQHKNVYKSVVVLCVFVCV